MSMDDDDFDPDASPPIAQLPLGAWHRERGARMVPFAGYQMPIQYAGPQGGILAEHKWTREHAGLFDVSHMGQLLVSGPGAAAALEALLPADLAALKPGRIRYSLLLAEDGGILDDLMVTNLTRSGGGEARDGETDGGTASRGMADNSETGEEQFYLVVNGATKHDDIAHLREHLPDAITLNHMEDQALLALQGPEAAVVLDRIFPGISDEISFMQGTARKWNDTLVGIGRSGYTGEDGFELSVPAMFVEALADALTAMDEVAPIGLGARDSLRLEAGLPLYGHDLTEETDPVTTGLAFAISKRRRAEGGFPGAERILSLLERGPSAQRVGLAISGRMAAREGAAIFAGEARIGTVTSGGFAPTVGAPIAMGFVESGHALPGTALTIDMRGRQIAAIVTELPFVPHRYSRKGTRR